MLKYLVTLFCVLALPLAAQPPLRDVAAIRDGIIRVGIAYEISQVCGSIDARLFRGLSYLQSLRAQARDLGYSAAQIDAYIDDRAEQDRLETLARRQLASMGAEPGNPESHCAVGRAQMQANTRIGWLLR